MKNAKSYVCSTLMASALLFAPFAQAEEHQSTNAAPDKAATNSAPNMEEMMEKMEELGKPGEAHKVLEPLVGEWDVESKCWMDPSAPPQVAKGTAKSTWILNGRFVREDYSGEMMGKPFNGISLAGYDNMQQKYKSVWIDDMSTAMFISEGTAEEGGKVLTFTSRMDCPMTGQKDMPVKHVIRIISNDKHTFEMFDMTKEANNKTMELTYTRK